MSAAGTSLTKISSVAASPEERCCPKSIPLEQFYCSFEKGVSMTGLYNVSLFNYADKMVTSSLRLHGWITTT